MSQRDWVEKDYYKVLGVSKEADKDEIKRAYRKLAQKHHPDANKGDAQAEERFKDISEAYAILSSEDKRRQYDEMRRLVEAGGDRIYGFGPDQGGGVRINIDDLFGRDGNLFEDLLGGFGFRGGDRAGRDLETEITLSFDEAMTGTTVSLPQGGKVRVPAGVGDGARIRAPGRGEATGPGRRPGDLFVRVKVRPHPIFGRSPKGDLVVNVPVTFTEAALGAEVEVPTLDGSVKVKVPAGTRSGRTLRVRGKGAPRARGGRGDLLVKIDVLVPQRLNRREKQLLEEFHELHKASPRAHLDDLIHRDTGQEVS